LAFYDENPSRFLVLVFIVLMIYQAALPSGLRFDLFGRDISLSLLPTGSRRQFVLNVIGNILPYYVFAHFVYLASFRCHFNTTRAVWISIVGASLMALSVETVQYINPKRLPDIVDVLCGVIGGFMGAFTGALYSSRYSYLFRKWVRVESVRNPMNVVAAMYVTVLCWDAARPFWVVHTIDKLVSNIKHGIVVPFEPPGRDFMVQLGLRVAPVDEIGYTLDYFGNLAELVIIYGLLFLFVYISRRDSGGASVIKFYAGILIFLELIHLLVVNGSFDMTRIAIGFMVIPAVLALSKKYVNNTEVGIQKLLQLCICLIFVAKLRPYTFGPMSTVTVDNFLPLVYQVQSGDVMMLSHIVEALADFAPIGMLIYLRDNRPDDIKRMDSWPPLLKSCLICGGLGLLTEIIQLWLPQRNSTLEDVLCAILGGYVGASAARLYYHYTLGNGGTVVSKQHQKVF
jgi:VanZ family protein